MNNKKTCSFTGYRPEKLPFGNDESDFRCVKLKETLTNEIEELINSGYSEFITGMALGIDMICGEIVLELRKKYPHIALSAAIPCKNQERHWDYDSITRYNRILQSVNNIIFVSNTSYFNGCMQKRNRYMVDNCDLLLAVFDGQQGGTMRTVEYAKKTGRRIVVIDPKIMMRISLLDGAEQLEQLNLF